MICFIPLIFLKSPPLLQRILERRQRQAQLEFFISLPLKDAKVFYFLVLRDGEREREKDREVMLILPGDLCYVLLLDSSTKFAIANCMK